MKIKYHLDSSPRSIWKNPIHFIACGFGVGAIPFFPGTFGTLLSIPFCILFSRASVPMYLVLSFLMIAISAYTTHMTCKDFGVHDHTATVSDEVAGFLLTMVAIPVNGYTLALGFIFFRFFDIVKPGPIAWVDRHVHGGIGVVLDDCLAAVFAWFVLYIILYVCSKAGLHWI